MRRTRLRPVSQKRLDERDERDAVRETVLRRQMFRCAAPSAFGLRCGGRLEVHELQGRGVRPGGHLDEANCIALCATHHRYVTDHPSAARIAGLRFESWEELPSRSVTIMAAGNGYKTQTGTQDKGAKDDGDGASAEH